MFERGLLISLPPQEPICANPAGSILRAEDLNTRTVSPELGAALSLIQHFAAYHHIPLQYTMRPEMFTYGASLAWLRDQIGFADSHIALSDGSAAKLVPGMHNHVFFYGEARSANFASVRRLAQRTPELFGAFETQINTAFHATRGSQVFCPPTIVFSSDDEGEEEEERYFFSLFLTPFSPNDCLQRILAVGRLLPPRKPYPNLIYVPLTETGLSDAAFAKRLAVVLTRTMFDETTALVLALPSAGPQKSGFERRLEAMLEALHRACAPIPPASQSNLFVATGRLSANDLRRFGDASTLLAHHSYDFWRSSPGFYAGFQSITVLADSKYLAVSAFEKALGAICGKAIAIEWTL